MSDGRPIRLAVARYGARIDPERIRRSSRRITVWLILAAVVGAATGLIVVLLQWLILDATWERLYREGPVWLQLSAPVVGLTATYAILRLWRTRSAATTEEYIRVFHDRRARMSLKDLPAKMAAAVFTIGSGGSLGLEGPSLLMGGTVGDVVQRRFARLFDREDAKVLLVAGGAAGVAAVFKAPLTGLVFAMEVPYRDDVARHVLAPALIASASGYLVEVSFRGVTPLVPIFGTATFDMRDLALSLLVGFAAGVAGRLLIWLYRRTGAAMRKIAPGWRIVTAGATLAGIGAISHAAYGTILTLGPGEELISAAALGGFSVGAVLGMLLMKAIATSVTAGAGGVGGLFFVTVAMGAALGGVFEHLAGSGSGTLFPFVGMAAMLGAAYHTPLAGVSFVAEATGRAGFIIPTFVATAAAFATIGRASLSGRQRFRRAGSMERMLDVPMTEVLTTDGVAVPAGTTLDIFVTDFALGRRHRDFAVVNAGGGYMGTIDIDAALAAPRQTWAEAVVESVMRTDTTVAGADWSVRRAMEAMAAADTDVLPVVASDGRFMGMVISGEILRLGEILDRFRADAGSAM